MCVYYGIGKGPYHWEGHGYWFHGFMAFLQQFNPYAAARRLQMVKVIRFYLHSQSNVRIHINMRVCALCTSRQVGLVMKRESNNRSNNVYIVCYP